MRSLTVIMTAIVLFLAGTASAEYYDMTALPDQSGYQSVLYETVTASDFLRAPSQGFNRLSFTLGSDFAATVYACATKEYAAGTCTSKATLSTSNDSVEIKTARPWLIIDVTAAETTGNVSYVTIRSHFTSAGGGGGGVLGEGPLSEMTASTPSVGDLWVRDDAPDANVDCSTAPGVGANNVLCMWTDDSAWEEAGVAGGTDNLGTGAGGGTVRITDIIGTEIDETAAGGTVGAGEGEFWVRNDAPTVAMFTDDTGVDYPISGNETFYLRNYDNDLAAAVTACEATAGGTVMVHSDGDLTVDMTAVVSPYVTLTNCSIQGYGIIVPDSGDHIDGPSTFAVTNSDAKTFIRMSGNGVRVENIGIRYPAITDHDATTICIEMNENTTTNGNNNMILDGVSCASSTAGGPGIGLRMGFVLKSTVSNSEFKRWDDAILLDGTVAANTFSRNNVRLSDNGVRWTSNTASSNNSTWVGTVHESNEVAVRMDASSSGKMLDLGGYYEPATAGGTWTQGNQYSILNNGTGVTYHGINPRFAGTLNAGRDIVRPAGFTTRGPDIVEGAVWEHGISYGTGTQTFGDAPRIHISKSKSIAGTATFTDVDSDGVITGGPESYRIESASDCDTQVGARDYLMTGEWCYDATDKAYWVCEGGANGWCDTTGEMAQVGVEADHTWTGAHDFDGVLATGTRETFTDADATPDVGTGSFFITNTTGVTITDFDGANILAGQIVTVESAGAIVYDCTTSGFQCGSTDITTAAGDLTSWLYDGTDWHLIAFTDQSTDMGTDGGGAGGGDALTVNTSNAIDTTANFADGDIDFTFVDGGAGGPDDITATVGCTGCIDATDMGTNSVAADEVAANAIGTSELDMTAAFQLSGAWDSTTTGTVDFAGAVTGTSFTSDASDSAEVRLTSATGGNDVVVDLVDNGATTTMNLQVEVGAADVTYIQLDGANATVEVEEPLIVSNGTSSGSIQINEPSGSGTNNATFVVPALAADTDYTLPTTDGDASQFLQTDGAGALTWASPAGGGTLTGDGTLTYVPYYSAAQVLSNEAAFNYTAATNTLVAGEFSGGGASLTNVDATTLDTIDSTGFAILAGQAGGQTLNGGTASGNDMTIRPTSNATDGSLILDNLADGIVLTTETATECVMLNAAGATLDASAGPTQTTTDGTNFPYVTLDFSDTTAQRVSWEFDLPDNLTGSTASVDMIYIGNADCDNVTTGDDDICFLIDGDSIAEDTTYDSALAGTQVEFQETCGSGGTTVGEKQVLASTSAFTHSMLPGERAVVLFSRDPGEASAECTAGEDDLTGDLSVLALRFCYEVDNVFSGE